MFDLPAQIVDPRRDGSVSFLQPLLHHPQSGIVGRPQLKGLVGNALAHARVGVILITLPALEDRVADAEQAGAIALEVKAEGPVQQSLRFLPRNRRMLEVELELSMNVGEVDPVEHPSLLL